MRTYRQRSCQIDHLVRNVSYVQSLCPKEENGREKEENGKEKKGKKEEKRERKRGRRKREKGEETQRVEKKGE